MLVLLMNLTTGVLHKLHFQHTEDWYTKWGESKNTSKDEIYLAARDCYYSVFFPSRQQREMFLLQFHPNDYKMIVLMIGWIMTSARFRHSIRMMIRSFAWNHSFITPHRFRDLQKMSLTAGSGKRRWDLWLPATEHGQVLISLTGIDINLLIYFGNRNQKRNQEMRN